MTFGPKSLYVHIPFCERKCSYCAFNSYAGAKQSLVDDYVEALIAEIQRIGKRQKVELDTVYVGGGTPTALDQHQLRRVLKAIRTETRIEAQAEWTVELNPGTVGADKLDVLEEIGVNRVSMGVQTFDASRLTRLGRIHTVEDVSNTVSLLKARGFHRINLDLIYGQPDQTLEDWKIDVARLLEQDCTHASLYALQYEEGTAYTRDLERGKIVEAAEDDVRSMFQSAVADLAKAGLDLYEISNFSKRGHESRHNINYWNNSPYFGAGAGAYGREGNKRLLNILDPREYVTSMREKGSAIAEEDLLTPEDDYRESLVTGLRTREGIDVSQLACSTGIDLINHHRSTVDRLCQQGFATFDGVKLSLTHDGLWVLDTIVSELMEIPTRNFQTT